MLTPKVERIARCTLVGNKLLSLSAVQQLAKSAKVQAVAAHGGNLWSQLQIAFPNGTSSVINDKGPDAPDLTSHLNGFHGYVWQIADKKWTGECGRFYREYLTPSTFLVSQESRRSIRKPALSSSNSRFRRARWSSMTTPCLIPVIDSFGSRTAV